MTANIPNDPVAIQRLYTSRDNNANASSYVGQQQRLWYNPITNAFYVSDGNTAGGIPVGSAAPISAVPIISRAGTANAVSITSSTPVTITGMTATPGAGTYLVTYNSGYQVSELTSVTQKAADDLGTLYAALMALTPTVTDHVPTYGGETLGPGVYTQPGASTLSGTLTLDAQNNPNALFVFRSVGAFSTAVASEVVLINGATSNNVWFVSEGSGSTGANSLLRGSLLANQAAVSTGIGSTIQGRILAIFGNADLGSTTIFTTPTGTTTLPLNSIVSFTMFASTGSLTNTGASVIPLSIGTNNGTITGFQTATIGGTIYPAGQQVAGNIHYGVYVDGVLFPGSGRSATRITTTSRYLMVLQAVVTVTAGQTIDIQSYADIGEFAVGPGMSMVLMPSILV